MFEKFSIKTKMVAFSLMAATFTTVVGGIGFYAMKNVVKDYRDVTDESLPKIEAVTEMRIHFRGTRIALRTLGLQGLTAEEGEKAIAEVEKSIQAYEEAVKHYRKYPFEKGEEELFNATERTWNEFKTEGTKVLGYYRAKDPSERAKMHEVFFNSCPRLATAYGKANQELVEFQNASAKRNIEEAEASAHHGSNLSLVFILAGTALSLLAGFLFSTSLSTVLRQIAGQLSTGAEQVTDAASHISTSSATLSSSATEQASALQETAASLEEMTSMVEKNAQNATRSNEFAESSQRTATKGKEAVTEVIGAIDEISRSNAEIMQQIERSNNQIADIVKVIAEIGNKTKVINDIVFQTKLLSFNASVEAARAGEHGKGFAVVAEEVGNLAQMSGKAAHEISGLLEESIRKVESIVAETQSKVGGLIAVGKDKVERGSSTARRCGEVLDEIVQNVSSVTQMIAEISSASQEQANGIREINRAMTQLDQVTQQNTNAAQSAASASSQLSAQADSLKQSLRKLMATVEGAQGEQAGYRQPARPKASSPSSTPATGAKVYRLSRKTKAPEAPVEKVVAQAPTLKKAVGGPDVPSDSDPRFQDL